MSKRRKTFVVPVKFVFEGEFYVKAKDEGEAECLVCNHCGLVLGRDIHSTLPDADVDWEFPVHPQKEISEAYLK